MGHAAARLLIDDTLIHQKKNKTRKSVFLGNINFKLTQC